jgi:hypothetical protein
MKANLISVAKATILGTGLLLSSAAWAGFNNTPEVAVQLSVGGGGSATGSMVGARFSADAIQYIGCNLQGGATQATVVCSARDKNNRALVCSTTNAWMREAAQGITDSSYFYFTVNSSGACTYLNVRDSSEHLQ